MVNQFISAVCIVAALAAGVLIMVRAASISQAATVTGRAFLLILGALIVLCFLRALLAAVVSAMLSVLTPVIIWLAIGSVAAIALCATQTFIPRLNKWLSARSSRAK